jgi:antitoxin ParD1/3/4
MATMNISLPDLMKDRVATQIETGRYANSSDFVRDLIRRDQESKAHQEALQAAIKKGLESGNAGLLDLEEVKRKGREKARSAGLNV